MSPKQHRKGKDKRLTLTDEAKNDFRNSLAVKTYTNDDPANKIDNVSKTR
jgi:hypothetical protein